MSLPPAPRLALPLLCLLALCAPGPAARAQQPFYTEDADVTDAGRLHHEAVNEFDVLSRGSLPARSQNATTFTLAYGLRKGVEVSVSAPLISIFNERGTVPRRPTGVGDTSFQIKYNFLREREGSRLPALTASFTVEVPAGSAEKGTGSGLFDYSLNGVVQKSVTGNTRVRANGGLVFAGNTTTWAVGLCARGLVFTGGASAVRQFTGQLSLGAEVTGALARDADLSRGQLQTQVGGNYSLNDRMTVDFGVIARRYLASPRLGLLVGLSPDF